MDPLVHLFTSDQPWAFFLAYRLQTGLASASLAVNLLLAVYAFSSGDCFNPHTSMWRSQLVIDVMVAGGFILDATSAFRFQEPLMQADPQVGADPSLSVPPLALSSPFSNSTVLGCTNDRPYLWVTLIARQWAAMLVFIMGLERLLFVRYPLWFKSIRVNKGPINVFAVFFALFSTGIAYTNAVYVAPDEPVHFTCEASAAFGSDFGWIFHGIVILPQVLGCLFCVIAALFVHRGNALRRFGGNRQKLASEVRKLRKVKWLLLSVFLCLAVPQSLLLGLRLLSPNGMFLAKLLVSQLFLANCFGNLLVYERATASTRNGICTVVQTWWKKRRKARVIPNESITSVSYLVAANQQRQQQQANVQPTGN